MIHFVGFGGMGRDGRWKMEDGSGRWMKEEEVEEVEEVEESGRELVTVTDG